jgi:hypothetical protein
MKTALQKRIVTVAPSISIVTHWEHDPDLRDIRKDCDGFDDEDPNDWQAWQSEVCATAIVNGEEITGNDYLGGTWEKAGDNPAESNPEISGYENGMTQEALCSLAAGIPDAHPLQLQIRHAIDLCQTIAAEDYAAQRAEIEASRNTTTV